MKITRKNKMLQNTKSDVENSIHGRQIREYKVMKHINKPETDASKLDIISEKQCINNCEQLWYDQKIRMNEMTR
jgi:hypothetical protein